MSIAIRKTLAAVAAAVVALAAAPGREAHADIVVGGSFGPDGSLGFNGNSTPSVSFGGDGYGSIYQIDGFINASGQNLSNNGSGLGASAELSYGTPSGIGYVFSESQPTAHQLLLTYTFTNNTGAALSNFQFLSYIDADIGANDPNYAYPNDSAATSGALGSLSSKGVSASSFEVGDPTYSTIYTDLNTGVLSNVNTQPSSNPGDVSTALGFNVGALGAGTSAQFVVMLSDDGSTIGNFSILQTNTNYPLDPLTISGAVTAVPEPASIVLLALGSVGALALKRRGLSRRGA